MPLTSSQQFEIIGIVYAKWSTAHDDLKAVKEEKPDKSEPDWHLLHAERLRRNTAQEARLWTLVSELRALWPGCIPT